MKKKRSAKQLANDKRLGRMAKKRAKLRRKKTGRKRTVGRKKTTRRKKNTLRARQTRIQRATNPKRKRSARSHLWLVFRCRGNSVHFCSIGSGKGKWVASKGDAILWKTKNAAAKSARYMAGKRGMSKYQVGVASDGMTSAQIAAGCRKGKV